MAATLERDELLDTGREPAICELRCPECGDGIAFNQRQCQTCGWMSPRVLAEEGMNGSAHSK